MTNSTIYDVAEQAGVSISTVSRVLNAPEQVASATRSRVMAAIDKLGFVPKAEATARARKGTRRIGVLVPFFTYPSFVLRLRGIASALREATYEMVVYNIESASQRDIHLATLPITRRIDGLVIMSLPIAEGDAQRLIANDLEAALIEFEHPAFSSVGIDDYAGGKLAAHYFAERGRRRCAFIGDSSVPDYALPTSQRRLEGFREGLRDFGLLLPPEYIRLAPHGVEPARQQAHELLNLPHPPDAIFAPSDTQAVGVLKSARELGVAVPQQLAVIGFDDVEVADYIGLTTVHQPLEESGRIAVSLLLARLAAPMRTVQKVVLPLQIVQRETA